MRWVSAALASLLLLGGCAQLGQVGAPGIAPPLPIETFGPSRGSAIRTLVAVVDGGGSPSGASSEFARAVAAALPDSAAVAILPPIGADTGDALSIQRIRAVGTTVNVLRQRYPSAQVVLVGHSTGAAVAADVAGTHRALIDALVLVSCPCTLPEWRKHNGSTLADGEATGLDPLLTAGGIEPDLRAVILVGAKDERTPPRFSRSYAEALALRGIATDFRVLPERSHDILSDPETINAVRRVAAALRGKDAA